MLTGHSLLIKILDWREKHLSEKTFVFLLATAVGLLSGCGAFVLKRLISLGLAYPDFAFSDWVRQLCPIADTCRRYCLDRNILSVCSKG